MSAKNFVSNITEQVNKIYNEINDFIVDKAGNQQFIKIKIKEHYLINTESYNPELRLVTGFAISPFNGNAYITLQSNENSNNQAYDLWIDISSYTVEDILNIIDDCFD